MRRSLLGKVRSPGPSPSLLTGWLCGDRDILRPMKRLGVLLMILVTACGGTTSAETTPPALTSDDLGSATTTTTDGESAAEVPQTSTTVPPAGDSGDPTDLVIPEPLERFEITVVRLDGDELLVAIAGNAAQRQQGLMNIDDLGSLAGMVFVFDQDSSGGFWMKNTLIPLDIAFFDGSGEFVDGFVMEPCTTADCPTYRPSGSYRFALEMPAGDMPSDPKVLVFAP